MRQFLRLGIPWTGILVLILCAPVTFAQTLAFSNSAAPKQEQSSVSLRDVLIEMQSKHHINIVFDEKLVNGVLIKRAKLKRVAPAPDLLDFILEGSGLHATEIRKDSY